VPAKMSETEADRLREERLKFLLTQMQPQTKSAKKKTLVM